MPAPDLIELFARPLQRTGARYLVAGSIGSMLYSEVDGEKHARDAKSMLAMSRDLIDFDALRREISKRGLEEAYRKLSGETL